MAAPVLHDERSVSSVPPRNIGYALDHGLRDIHRWRVPVLLRLDSDVTPVDVRAALTAVVNHHDALRTSYTAHAGGWGRRVSEPQEFGQLSTWSFAEDVVAGSAAESDAVAGVVAALLGGAAEAGPLSAAYIAAVDGGRARLAIALHRLVCDEASVAIVVGDIVTAVTQQMAGQEIVLAPVATQWADCVARVVECPTVGPRTTMAVTDFDVADAPHADDLTRFSLPLSDIVSRELDGARRHLGVSVEEVLLAALARAVERALGRGTMAVDVGRAMRDGAGLDLGRTVGALATRHTVELGCVPAAEVDATQMLIDVRAAVAAETPSDIGRVRADVAFSYIGTVPEPVQCDLPAQIDGDWTMPVRDVVPGLGHALEVRAYRSGGVMHLDWWYDSRRYADHTIEELAEQFALTLIEITSEAVPGFVDAA